MNDRDYRAALVRAEANERTNLHFLRLAEPLGTTDAAMADMPRSSANTTSGHTATLQEFWTPTMRQAQTQTCADAFLALMTCPGISTILVPLMRAVVPLRAPVPDAH